MVDKPTLTVQVAFDSDPLATTPTWTTIGSYVRSGTIRMGRSNELAEFQASQVTLELDNRTRLFDPTYTSGTYYGKLLPRKQLKLTATYGTGALQWVGFVRSWPVSPQIAGDNVCRLEAYDALSYLAQQQLPPDYFTYVVESNTYSASNLAAFWPLGSTDRLIGDRAGNTPWTWTTTEPRTCDAPSPWLSGGGTTFDGTYGAIGPVIDASTTYTLSFFFRTTEVGPVGGILPILADSLSTGNAIIGIDEYGRVAYRSSTGSLNSGLAGNDGNWHHVVFRGGASGSLYVDGYNLTTSATGFHYDGTGWALLGMSNNTTDSQYYNGDLSNVAIWTTDIFESGATKLASAGLHGVPTSGATTDACATEVLNAIGWPSAWRALETGIIQSGGMTWNTDALSMLQTLALTEGGRVFADRNGYVAFHNGSHDYTDTRATTSQATFSDSNAAGVVPFSSVDELTYSEEFLANRVTATTATGQGFTADDTASQTTYGIRSLPLRTIFSSQLDAQTRADLTVTRYATPQLRVNGWACLPQRSPAVAFPEVLDLRLADRITFELQPARLGNTISQVLLVESIQHDFTPDTWRSRFCGSPAPLAWLLEDTTYGLLETTTVLA